LPRRAFSELTFQVAIRILTASLLAAHDATPPGLLV